MKQKQIFILFVIIILCSLAYCYSNLSVFCQNRTEKDWESILPAPPISGSKEQLADVQAVFLAQSAASSDEITRARSEFNLNPTIFKSIFPTEFSQTSFPAIYDLMKYAFETKHHLVNHQKRKFARKRPPLEDSRIKPLDIASLDQKSYPSGHSFAGALWSMVLADLLPQKKDEIIHRGQEIGWDRIIAGMHHPSDVYAGRALAQLAFNELKNDPIYIEKKERAKTEVNTKQIR